MMRWSDREGYSNLYLFTSEEFSKLPDGIKLESINGYSKVKGQDEIDQDTRAGYVAWGVRDPFEHAEKHLFLTFLLTQ